MLWRRIFQPFSPFCGRPCSRAALSHQAQAGKHGDHQEAQGYQRGLSSEHHATNCMRKWACLRAVRQRAKAKTASSGSNRLTTDRVTNQQKDRTTNRNIYQVLSIKLLPEKLTEPPTNRTKNQNTDRKIERTIVPTERANRPSHRPKKRPSYRPKNQL